MYVLVSSFMLLVWLVMFVSGCYVLCVAVDGVCRFFLVCRLFIASWVSMILYGIRIRCFVLLLHYVFMSLHVLLSYRDLSHVT